jgi:hypothetical protein
MTPQPFTVTVGDLVACSLCKVRHVVSSMKLRPYRYFGVVVRFRCSACGEKVELALSQYFGGDTPPELCNELDEKAFKYKE